MIETLQLGVPYKTKQGKTVTGLHYTTWHPHREEMAAICFDDKLMRNSRTIGVYQIGSLTDFKGGTYDRDIDINLLAVGFEQLDLFDFN